MEGRRSFLVYDLEQQRLIPEISDYAYFLNEEKRNSQLTIEQGIQHLAEFWRYLLHQKIELTAISDSNLKLYRNSNLIKVKKSKSHRGSEDDAKRTVNLKLSRIYDWLIWLQSNHRLPVGTVSMHGPVSAAKEMLTSHPSRSRRHRKNASSYLPLLFRVSGTNSKHGLPDYRISDNCTSALFSLFIERYTPFIAQRNILFSDIAEAAGFRRGSICSLRVDQFLLEDIASSDGEFLVRPSRQKFNYQKTFAISIELAYRIRYFIDDHWLPWVKHKNLSRTVHQQRLFLSATTGKPITERAMTQMISAGFRALGLPKGAGAHKLRSKFASEEADRDLAERLELGLDTSSRSIAASMAMKLGHNDPNQFFAYAASSQAQKARIQREGVIAELKQLREEVARLKAQLDAIQSDI